MPTVKCAHCGTWEVWRSQPAEASRALTRHTMKCPKAKAPKGAK